METKKYTSYAEIEHDLEILKLEKEIHYKKMQLSFEKTKERFMPSKSVTFFGDSYSKYLSGTTGTIVKMAIPYLINWLINRKRGN